MLKEHVNNVGRDDALGALGKAKEGGHKGVVQYEGAYDELGDTKKEGDFIKDYLSRAGVKLIHQDTEVNPALPHVSTWTKENIKEQGRPERQEKAGDYLAKDSSFANDKLKESKLLHGEDRAEDLSKLMGKPVTNLTPEVIKGLDEKYGKAGWVVKSYGEEAYAGFGVMFSQRASQIKNDAKSAIADARGRLKEKGYNLVRDEKGGEIIGIGKGRDVHMFGSKQFDELPKSVQTLGKQVRQSAPNERGARMPRSSEDVLQNDYGMTLRRGKDGVPDGVVDRDGKEHALDSKHVAAFEEQEGGSAGKALHRALERDEDRRNGFNPEQKFYVEPAFKAIGVTAADRAAGATWETAKEGRVHIITRDGKAEAVPYATLQGRGDSVPVVFHNKDSLAMEKAVQHKINSLPLDQRSGQLYAPDVVKTKDGWKVIELNPSAVGGGSDWLGGNPLVIDAVASHVAGREPQHVGFIRDLLESNGVKTPKLPVPSAPQPRQEGGTVKGGGGLGAEHLRKLGISKEDAKAEGITGNEEVKPAACTCKNWPAVKFRNGSTHEQDCPIHKSWLAAGGFHNRDKVQGDDGLWTGNMAMDQPRDPDGKFGSTGSLGTINTVTHGSLKVQYSEHTTKRIDGPSIPLPNIKQKDDHSCSFVAALTVAKHFNKDVDPTDVLKHVRASKSGGMDRSGVRRGLDALGVDTEYKKDLNIGDLRRHVDQGTPVMLTVYPEDWSSDHWTVVQGFSGKGADARIHLSNHKSMPVAQFKDEWFDKGEGIICHKRTDNANPEGCNQHTGPGCSTSGGSFSSHEDVRKAQTGDPKAVEKVLDDNRPMLHKLANRWSKGDKTLHADLVQEGNMGLLTAIKKFNFDKGTQFSTYAWQWARAKIGKAGKDAMKVKELEKQMPEDEKGKRVDVAAAKDKPSFKEDVDRALKTLTGRDRDVIERYHGLGGRDPQTMKEIGKHHGITEMRVSQLVKGALEKMRSKMTDNSWHRLLDVTLNAMVLNAAEDGHQGWLVLLLAA